MRVWVLVIYTALSLSAATAAVLKPSPAFGATEQRTKQPEPKAEPAAKKEPSRTTPQDQEAVSAEDTKASEAREGVSLLPGIASGPEDKDTKDRKRVEPTAVRLQRPSDIDDRQKFVRENRPAWDNVPAYIRSARPSSDETLPNVRAERPSIYGNPPFAEPYTPPVTALSLETEPSAPAETSGRTKSELPRKKKITRQTPPLSGVRTRLKRPRDSEAVKEEQAKSSKRSEPERKGEAGRGRPSRAEQEKMPLKASETPHASPEETI